MAPALHTHARHQSPSAKLRIVGLDRFQCQVAIISTNCVDLATDRGQPKFTACSAHIGQRLPAIGLRVVHLRRVEKLRWGSLAAHGVELAIKSDAAMPSARVLWVVQIHRAEPPVALAAHNEDQPGLETRARHHLRAVDRGQHCVGEHLLRFRRAQRGPRTHGLPYEPLRHHREAHVLHHGKQLGLGPLAGFPPAHDPQKDSLLALGHQPILLDERQHLRARRQLRRQLLEAAQRRLHRGLLERRQREDVGEPPHIERVGRHEARPDRVGARLLERVDHEARSRLEHPGQQALVDLTFALLDEGQQRLERLRADALERVGCIGRVAHARLEEV
eukprot:scaffold84902_cov63-Phaeocystis_antarctica.AAC.2